MGELLSRSSSTRSRALRALRSLLLSRDFLFHFVQLEREHIIRLHLTLDGVDGGHDGRVVAIENLTDVGEGHIGDIAQKIDGNVNTRPPDLPPEKSVCRSGSNS